MKNPGLGDLNGFGYGPNLAPYWILAPSVLTENDA